eukprot:5625330-Pyramimonas_sp.AAC.1
MVAIVDRNMSSVAFLHRLWWAHPHNGLVDHQLEFGVRKPLHQTCKQPVSFYTFYIPLSTQPLMHVQAATCKQPAPRSWTPWREATQTEMLAGWRPASKHQRSIAGGTRRVLRSRLTV